MLELDGITAGYDDAAVLRDVTVSVPAGSKVALIGPNGAGKTTLLRVASGLLVPQRGRVLLDGDDVTGRRPDDLAARGICHVPEGRGVFPNLTVAQTLRLFARPGEEAEAQERAVDAFPRLGERLGQLVGTMSGGEQQMVAIGRAMMSAPAILMLDEPSLGLSPLLCKQVFKTLAEIRKTGSGILLVEQNARQALAIADRGYLLENGHVVGEGPATRLAQDAAVQRAYLGGPPAVL
jgi:branched-chain amino acid transport system ATP-binding protein